MNTQIIKKLINEAKKARKGSYSPYSKYAVGAALITDNGKIYTGANVENASFGLTICAERSAIFKAVNDGAKKIKAIAVVAEGDNLPSPCGACRQVIAEFSTKDTTVIFANTKDEKKIKKIFELLPYMFVFKK